MEENRSLQPAGIAGILITEAIAVILLLLALTAMKYFFKGSYEDIKSFYDTLKEFTEFTYIRSVPASQKIADVEAFLISKLNNDTPVFMHNLMEWKAQDYMSSINVQSHCNFGTVTWDESPDFDNHWMTVTKYYKNNNTGDKFVAFISWGYRFSINADLLIKNNTQYRPDFYTYELLPKT